MAVVNASGTVQDSYTYDVYGTPTKTGSLANEFDFAGQQTDGTGLQYLRARYYDPATGTFLSRDPASVGTSWTNHPHGYVNGRPTFASDPTGLCAFMMPCWERALTSEDESSWLDIFHIGQGVPILIKQCTIIDEYPECQLFTRDAYEHYVKVNGFLDEFLDWLDRFIGVGPLFRTRIYTFDDGSEYRIPDDYKIVGRTDNGRGITWMNNNGDTIRVMQPNANNPTGYIRWQNSSGQYTDALGTVNEGYHRGLFLK